MNELFCIPKANTNVKVGIIILSLKVILSYTSIGKYISQLDGMLSMLAVFFLVISIVNKKYSIRTLFLYTMITLLGLVTSKYVGNVMLFITILTILAIKKETRVIYFLMKYESLILAIAVICSIIAGDFLSYDVELKRYLFDFGFSHPNLVSCIIFNILIMWIWVNYEYLNSRIYLLIILFLVIIFFMTNCRTMLLLGILTIILVELSKSRKQES